MSFLRRFGLVVVSACLGVGCLVPLRAQDAPQQQPPQQPPPAQPPKPQTPPQPAANPFEAPQVEQAKPELQTPAQPAKPSLEGPKPANMTPEQLAGQVVEGIEIRGARRVPQDTLKAMMLTKPGDIYSDEGVRRDFMILWNTKRFDDVRLETEPGRSGVIVRFVVTERRVIRSINYEGIHSITVSEILDRFKERKVPLSVESQYEPDKVQRAAIEIKDFLAERGRQYATVDPQIEQIPPSSLKVTFNVNEGPKVKVGDIKITGNQAEPSRWVVWQMKNLHPYGVPHSLIAENLFAKTFDQAKLEEDKQRIVQGSRTAGTSRPRRSRTPSRSFPRAGTDGGCRCCSRAARASRPTSRFPWKKENCTSWARPTSWA